MMQGTMKTQLFLYNDDGVMFVIGSIDAEIIQSVDILNEPYAIIKTKPTKEMLEGLSNFQRHVHFDFPDVNPALDVLGENGATHYRLRMSNSLYNLIVLFDAQTEFESLKTLLEENNVGLDTIEYVHRVFISIRSNTVDIDLMARQLPGIMHEVVHPETNQTMTAYHVIMELNDHYRWSRERIADWIETWDEVPVFTIPEVEEYANTNTARVFYQTRIPAEAFAQFEDVG